LLELWFLGNRSAECAGIAQSVEQLIRNEKVGGSIPLSGTITDQKKPSSQGWVFL
jgi:hypothetical protein